MSGRSSSIPKNKKELKDIVYNKCLPESLKRPVVVRCKTEDPALLRKRQNLQQSKSIHELSKIRMKSAPETQVRFQSEKLKVEKLEHEQMGEQQGREAWMMRNIGGENSQ